MIFDTDQDKIGISFHNITKSKMMAGRPWISPKHNKYDGDGSDSRNYAPKE